MIVFLIHWIISYQTKKKRQFSRGHHVVTLHSKQELPDGMLPFFSEYVLPYAILGSKLIVFNFRFMSENPVPCSLLLILENWKILCKTRRYPKIRSDQSSLYLSRLDSHAKENANSSYQRGNQIPL